jgi:peptidoglycan/xylan/chitin deacetylase (PgdA/CDA1 family)
MPDDTEAGRNFLNLMLDRGHQIGIHCMSHEYHIIYASVEAYLADFNEAWNLVYEQTGYKPYLFRFPGGSKNDFNKYIRDDIIAEMTRRGFVYFDWNVDSEDALGRDWTTMYNTVLNQVAANPRSVILFHDRPGGYNTVLVIEDIIKALLADPKDYIFSAITPETRPIQF